MAAVTTTAGAGDGLWDHLWCYVFRTAPYDELEESTETGVSYTGEQCRSINHMREMLKSDADDDAFTDPSERDGQLTKELPRLCFMTVQQSLEMKRVYQSPLMHFLAVMGIDATAGKLRGAFTYTPILAAALWVNRLLMLEMALSSKGWRSLGIPSREEVTSFKARVDEVRQRHLCVGTSSPTSAILSQLAMGRRLNKAYGRPGNIFWADADTIVHNGKHIPLAKVQDLAKGVIIEAQEALDKLTFGKPLPDIDLGVIADPLGSTTESRKNGYNERIQQLQPLEYMLKRSVAAPKEYQLYDKGPDGKLMYNDRRVKNWLAAERECQRKIMVAMQVINSLGTSKLVGIG